MNLWRTFRSFVRRRRVDRIGEEIDHVLGSMRRTHSHLERMRDAFYRNGGSCCPSCAFGSSYSDAAEKLERTGEVAQRLLAKRGTFEDYRLAKAIYNGNWP